MASEILLRRMARALSASEPPEIERNTKEFPRPSCSDLVPTSRIAIITETHEAVSDVGEVSFFAMLLRRSASMIATEAARRGFVRMEYGARDSFSHTMPVRATLGVVSQDVVSSMERRIAARQADVAREVIRVAAGKIHHWGSYYGESMLHKTQAVDSMNEAMHEVLTHRASIKRGADIATEEQSR